MVIEVVAQALAEALPARSIELSADARGIVTLRGVCQSWDEVVKAGLTAGKQSGVKNVVNKLRVEGMSLPQKDYGAPRAAGEAAGLLAEADVLIIGAGITGCGIARALSKYDLKILVAEMSDDVATGATKANNGNIHPGHAVTPGTLKAKLNIEGNRMYDDWAGELNFALDRSGAMGAVTEEILLPFLEYAYDIAVTNGVDGVEVVDAQRAYELEPGLRKNGFDNIVGALWLPSMGLVEPYEVACALAENAAENGVDFLFNCTVADILHENGRVHGAVTSRGIIRAKYIINCAGLYADEISAMAGDECYTIHPRRGVIAILDKSREPLFNSLAEVITLEDIQNQTKNENSKGGGMCRTPDGHILMGPSAIEIPDKGDLSTTAEELDYAMGRGQGYGGYGDIIRYFAGNRPADYKEDFMIEASPVTLGFINVGGIQSPGLAAAPAIAKMVEEILLESAAKDGFAVAKKENWQPKRAARPQFRNLSREEQDALIQKDPAYGKIICRCESITEGEILDVLRSPVPPASVDAVKRRTRAGMGRCQGGFCQPRVLEILARERGEQWCRVSLKGEGSEILLKNNRAGEEQAK